MLTASRRLDLLLLAANLNSAKAYTAAAHLLAKLDIEDLIAEPALGYYLANAWVRLDNHDEAWELVCRLEEPLRNRGFDRLHRLRLNLEGILLLSRNDLDGAEAVFSQVHVRSAAAGDRMLTAHATVNLGTVTAIRGDWEAALVALQRALTEAQLYGTTHGVAACHQNLGVVCRELGHLHAANKHFVQAFELTCSIGADVGLDVAGAEYERALVMMALGDRRGAEVMARRSLERVVAASADSYPATRSRGEAMRTLGIVLLSQGRRLEGRLCLEDALGCARAASYRLLEGEVCEAFVALARAENDELEAAIWIQRAQSAYLELGAIPRLERVGSRSGPRVA